MDKNRFNRDVRPLLAVIPIGTQGLKSRLCAPARYSDADRRRKSLYLKAASYEFLVTIRRRFTTHPALPSVPAPVQPTAYSSTTYGSRSPAFYFLEAPNIQVPRGEAHPAFDVHAIRRDFPILATHVH